MEIVTALALAAATAIISPSITPAYAKEFKEAIYGHPESGYTISSCTKHVEGFSSCEAFKEREGANVNKEARENCEDFNNPECKRLKRSDIS